MMKGISIYLVGLLLFTITTLSSQIVNIEDLRSNFNEEKKWNFSADLGLSLQKNVQQVLTADASLQIEHRSNRHYFISATGYRTVQAGGKSFVNNLLQHYRYNYDYNHWLTQEVFMQAQIDKRLALDFRGLMGIGVRMFIFEIGKQRAYFGLHYMFEYEEEVEGIIRQDQRISSYMNLRLSPAKNVEFNSTTYFQPLIDKWSDWRINTVNSLLIQISSNLKFKSSLTFIHDQFPPESIPEETYSFVNGLVIRF